MKHYAQAQISTLR